MNKFTLVNLFLILLTLQVSAQSLVKEITLQEAIDTAKEQSIQAMEAKNTLQIAHWEYRNFRADLLPNVDLSGTLPNLNKSYNSYQNEDGTYKFVPTSTISEDLSLSVTQNIPFTGGKISLQTQIYRQDELGKPNTTEYLTVPIMVTLSQPIFSYNPLKWDRRIEPIKNIESQKQYVTDIENVCIEAVNYYFEFLLSQINKNIAEQNKKNATQLYEIAKSKKTRGLISENDIQQLNFGYINASASVIEAEQVYLERMYKLRTFLGYNETVVLVPVMPNNSPMLSINYNDVMNVVKLNNPFYENINRRGIDSDRLIAEARSERGPKLDVNASFGYTGNNKLLPESYQNLNDRAVLSLGITVPILDWGRGKGKVIIAEYQKEVESGRITQDMQNFEQDMMILVSKIQSQPTLVEMSKQADSIAHNRYKIAYETFIIGQISVLDINTAQIEEDNSRRDYISQLYLSWLYYYQLRQTSLYDFVNKRDIINNITQSKWTKRYLNKLLDKDE